MQKFLDHLNKRIRWSWQGLAATWNAEYSFRIWVYANLISLFLIFVLPLDPTHDMILIIMGLLVLVAELFNTAVERIVDRISMEQHPLSGQAKDAASAAVMLTAIATGIIWIWVICITW